MGVVSFPSVYVLILVYAYHLHLTVVLLLYGVRIHVKCFLGRMFVCHPSMIKLFKLWFFVVVNAEDRVALCAFSIVFHALYRHH